MLPVINYDENHTTHTRPSKTKEQKGLIDLSKMQDIYFP